MSVEFPFFLNNSKLCVARATESYLELTKTWRTLGRGRTQLLLSTIELPPGS